MSIITKFKSVIQYVMSRPWAVGAVAGVLALGFVVIGAAATLAFVSPSVSESVQGRLAFIASQFEPEEDLPDTFSVDWTVRETALLTLETAFLPLGNVAGEASGGGVDAWGDVLIYSAPNGRLGFVDFANKQIEYSDVRIPMDYDNTRREYLNPQIEFNQAWYRVTDVLLVEGDNPSEALLYAAHHLYTPEDDQICMYISSIAMKRDASGVQFVGDEWTTVTRTNACNVMSEIDWGFGGHLSGGRIVELDDEHLLLSIGTFGTGNFHGWWDEVTAESGNDLGKIIRVNRTTGETDIYAAGVRNPQGLIFDAEGRLWETEHGPQGGDELNLIKPGIDYGWPHVSYGTDYGAPREPLPLNPVQGRHDGYALPVYAFVPSVGMTQVIPMGDKPGFDLWRGDILVMSMKGETLYHMRVEDDRVTYAEPIFVGKRLRDGIQMDNGWLAMITDDDGLFLVRDPAVEEDAAASITLAGYDKVEEIEAIALEFDKEFSWGRMRYSSNCASCHLLNGEVRVGPPLNGIIGRKVASFPDYPYSEGMQSIKGKWTVSKLARFLENPKAMAPDTTMTAHYEFDPWEFKVIAEYIASVDEEGLN